jgi:pimeloyl-ACP methyl ester esterase
LPVTHHLQTVYPQTFHPQKASTQRSPIVLLNGWGMAANVWDALIPILQQQHDVIVIDVIYSENADAICHTIHQELPKPCVLIGWSLGGMLATKIAALYPESVVGLITLASNTQFVADSDWPNAMPADTFEAFVQLFTLNPEKALQRFSGLVVQGDQRRREQKQYLQSLKETTSRTSNPSELMAGLVLLREIKNQAALTIIRCPSMHCFGENDALVPISTVESIQSVNSLLSCQIIPESSHLLHVPINRIEKRITRFLVDVFNCQGESL